MAKRGRRTFAKHRGQLSQTLPHLIVCTLVCCIGVGVVFLFGLPGEKTFGIGHPLSYISVNNNIAKEMEYQENAPKKEQESDGIILHGSRSHPTIALTFDAEMTDSMKENLLSGRVSSSFDRRIVETLIHTNTPATFFLTGMWMQLYPKETRELAKNPLFELASHSFADTAYTPSCYDLPTIPDQQDIFDIEKTQTLLQQATGTWNTYFRFPGGCYTKTDLDIVQNQAKLTIVHWDVAGEDGFNDDASSIANHVISQTQNGSIIILHLNGAPTAPKTADALPRIITALEQKGFIFVTISQLLQQ